MNKWKEYELITTVAKKVGGPIKLVLIVGGSGIGIGIVLKIVYDKIKNRDINIVKPNNYSMYSMNRTGYINDSIELCEGTKFIVLNRDENAVIIVVKGENEPVVALYEKLNQMSNYS